jgi:hypothetical protein
MFDKKLKYANNVMIGHVVIQCFNVIYVKIISINNVVPDNNFNINGIAQFVLKYLKKSNLIKTNIFKNLKFKIHV